MEAINADVRAQLKRQFEQLFPEQAKRLQAISDNMRQATATEKADYEAELDRIRADLFDIIGRKYGKVLGKNDDDGLAIQLRPEKYGEFVNARGSDIETKMLLLLDSLSRLQDVDKSNTDAVVATIIYGGLSAVTASAIAYITKLVTDSAMELLPAAFATVEFCTTSTIVTAVCVVVVMLIIPLIYFVEKPAVCIALVINELRQDLVFTEDYCVHGKRVTTTSRIPKITKLASGDTLYSAGLFASQKKDSALIGTQYGFTLKQQDIDKVKFSFGMGCPLAQGKNNCAVGFDQTAKSIAEDADRYQKQSDSQVKDEYELAINCNSASGSVAYYVVRVRYH